MKYPTTSATIQFRAFGSALRSVFHGPERQLPSGEKLQALAVVSKTDARFIEVVTHNTVSVEVLQLNHDDFVRLYRPTLISGRKAAAVLLKLCESMNVVPPAETLLRTVLLAPEEVKVQRDKTKTLKKAAAAAAGFATYGPGPRGKDHTCILISRDDKKVRAITMYDGEIHPLVIAEIHAQEFDQWYAPSDDYPVEKLAALYLEYAIRLGGSADALDVLGKIIHINDGEYEVATAKKAAADAGKTEKTTGKAPAAKVDTKAKPAATAKADTKAKASAKPADTKAKPAEAKDKKPSAASRFQELIMAGGKTDDEIFAIVQKEFGLDDSKKTYVKWYRNHLTKQGKNPPAAKEPKK